MNPDKSGYIFLIMFRIDLICILLLHLNVMMYQMLILERVQCILSFFKSILQVQEILDRLESCI